jgi:transposase
LDSSGETLGELRVVADASMLRILQRWASSWPQRLWAIEGAAGPGRLLAQQLVAADERVVDVPSALAARARVLARSHGRKTDGIDARSVALVAQHRRDLLTVAADDDHSAVLRLLSDRRDELTGERRRTVNRLHRALRRSVRRRRPAAAVGRSRRPLVELDPAGMRS